MLEPHETMRRAQICLSDSNTKKYKCCVFLPLVGNCRIELIDNKIIIGEWPNDIALVIHEGLYVREIC
jgi:hypothetical protein